MPYTRSSVSIPSFHPKNLHGFAERFEKTGINLRSHKSYGKSGDKVSTPLCRRFVIETTFITMHF